VTEFTLAHKELVRFMTVSLFLDALTANNLDTIARTVLAKVPYVGIVLDLMKRDPVNALLQCVVLTASEMTNHLKS